MKSFEELRAEALAAPFSGWDFSWVAGRIKRTLQTPWDYDDMAIQAIHKGVMAGDYQVLDMHTGGGERLGRIINRSYLSWASRAAQVTATEEWEENLPIAKAALEPMGVSVVVTKYSRLRQFSDGQFDLVLNHHGHYYLDEVVRVCKADQGDFLTQQVGGDNLHDLIEYFEKKPAFPYQTPKEIRHHFKAAGFSVLFLGIWEAQVRFLDIGALVYFLAHIPWAVPGFDPFDLRDEAKLRVLDAKMRAHKAPAFTETRFIIRAGRR